ncbi:MAG: hypothetical protein NZM12_11690 [Steroidobacteraceae bacterium]|nr:hypothetical protein [Steroidobacteraceae bacterium]
MAVASSDGVFADFLPESMPIWVARRLSRRVGDKKTPKYVTIRLKDSSPTCVLICKGIANEKTASRPVVIVEDVLSALKLAAAGFDGLALCGVSLRADEHLHAIKSHPVVIWFDNDNKQVLDRARLCRDAVIAARTGLEHGYPITMITPDLYVGDPKSASYSTINELVNGVLERA